MGDCEDCVIQMERLLGSVVREYEFLREITSGPASTTYLVKSYMRGQQCVAKVGELPPERMDEVWPLFEAEITKQQTISHQNIMKIDDYFREGNLIFVIQNYCPNGSLIDHIKKNGPLKGDMLCRIVQEMCSALMHLWEFGGVHGNLRPHNILLDTALRVKITDVRISALWSNSEADKHAYPGEQRPFICIAPEVLLKTVNDPIKVDLWATGVTILWTALGRMPWACADVGQMISMISRGCYTMPTGIDPTVGTIVKRMLAVHPAERGIPTVGELESIRSDDGKGKKPGSAHVRISEPRGSKVHNLRRPIFTAFGRSAMPPRALSLTHCQTGRVVCSAGTGIAVSPEGGVNPTGTQTKLGSKMSKNIRSGIALPPLPCIDEE